MLKEKRIRVEILEGSEYVGSKKVAIIILSILVFCIIAMGFTSVLFLEAKEAEIFILEQTQISMTEDIIKLETECDC